MQIPVLNGVYASTESDFRTSYPRNLIPVPKQQGISSGYLRPAEGIVLHATGPGSDRGGINWNGQHYRVMGTKLVRISEFGTVTTLGDVGPGGYVRFDYSFDRLGIASGNRLYYLTGSSLAQVTDPELGVVVDFLWVDGYFMTTDGANLVVTELANPFAVDPLKYGSSEADPDSVKALIKLRNEVYALNRYTIEVFQNVGGDLFPFQRIEGAQMQRGTIGTRTAAMFMESIAFVGGGRNEAPGVWMGANSSTQKISTREIDQLLLEYSEGTLAAALVEVRITKNHQFLYVHLPDQTLVFDGAASQAVGEPVWFILTSSVTGTGQYRASNFVWCFDKWLAGDPTADTVGYLTDSVSSHYGAVNGWEFGTLIVYNEGNGAIFHELELACLSGNVAMGENPTIWTSYTIDGITWSQERARTAGRIGERVKRIAWLQQGFMRHWRIQKFRGTSDSHIAIARLEATLEPLNV